MNPALQNQLKSADEVMAANGETQPTDLRAVTSPVNGKLGGRPPIDCTALASEYKSFYSTNVRWGKDGFKEYDPRLGAYRRRTDKEIAARVGAFLVASGRGYSKNLENSLVGALRATPNPELRPPVFLSTGQSARGWISMKNGLLNVEAAARGEKVKLLPHTTDFFSYRTLPYDWNPDAPCPRFIKFLHEVQPDEATREMLQMLAGLLLVEDPSYDAFWICVGEGGTGKSTFLRLLKSLLGPENVCSIPLYRFSEKHLTFKLASTLANLVDEAPNADMGRWGSLVAAESILKSIASGGEVHVEPKGVDADDQPATARCVFCQNPPLPPFVDRTNGLWRRLRVIPFDVVIDGTDKEENNLAGQIVAEGELPGMLAWAVQGLGKLRKLTVFPQCPKGAAMIADNRAMLDKEGAFLCENYKFSEGNFVSSADIATAYAAWCKEECYPTPKGPQAFAADIRRVFPGVKYHTKTVDGKKKRGWLNIARVGLHFDFSLNRVVAAGQ
jgi:P4 family phage/plasmid primase-like protien